MITENCFQRYLPSLITNECLFFFFFETVLGGPGWLRTHCVYVYSRGSFATPHSAGITDLCHRTHLSTMHKTEAGSVRAERACHHLSYTHSQKSFQIAVYFPSAVVLWGCLYRNCTVEKKGAILHYGPSSPREEGLERRWLEACLSLRLAVLFPGVLQASMCPSDPCLGRPPWLQARSFTGLLPASVFPGCPSSPLRLRVGWR